MIIFTENVIHPNAIKHSAELLGEDLLPQKVLDELITTNFNGSKNGLAKLKEFLHDKVNTAVYNELITKVNKYIYSIDSMKQIIADYADTRIVRKALKYKLKKENNNRNSTYDFEAILNDFKSKCIEEYSNYDFSTNGLFKSLIFSFNKYYCPKYDDFIYSIFNDKGTLVETEDGTLLLENLASIDVKDKKVTIDFSNIVKDIYEGSKDLFMISGEIHYDLFTHYLSKELERLDKVIRNTMKQAFKIESLGPRVITNIKGFGNVPYRVKTLRKRVELLEVISLNVKNGLTLDSLQILYNRAVESDALITDANIGKLFEHKSTISTSEKLKKSNYKKFLDIVRGVVALNILVTYLHESGHKLYEDDFILFRDEAYYKRFQDIEDYLLLKDITKDLIEESVIRDDKGNVMNIADNIPFMTNDECYDYLSKDSKYEFSSLKDFVKSSIEKNTNPYNVKKSIQDLRQLCQTYNSFYVSMLDVYNTLEQKFPGVDLSDPQFFDFAMSVVPNAQAYMNTLFFMFSPEVKEIALMEKDLRLVLRYLNLSVNVIYHLVLMLEESEKNLEYCILTMKKDRLYLPDNIQNISQLSLFSTFTPLKFFLIGDEDIENISFRKQYYLIYADIIKGIGPSFKYLKNWINKVESKVETLAVSLSLDSLPEKLKQKSIIINGKENNSSDGLEAFLQQGQLVGGFLFINGAIYRHRDGYIHERGYFVNPDLDYMITPIPRTINFFRGE